jgi:hypothetical protein
MKQEQNTLARILLAAAATMLALPAHADDILLSCRGTLQNKFSLQSGPPKPVSKGVIVDLKERTIKGFGDPIAVYRMGDTEIAFQRSIPVEPGGHILTGGHLDRVTGDMQVSVSAPWGVEEWTLKCRPTQKLF